MVRAVSELVRQGRVLQRHHELVHIGRLPVVVIITGRKSLLLIMFVCVLAELLYLLDHVVKLPEVVLFGAAERLKRLF